MRGLHAVGDPRPNAAPSGPEIVIRPKFDQAARVGVTVQSIASTARIATLGDVDANVPKLDRGRAAYPDPHPPAGRLSARTSTPSARCRC